jgi:hypothetical protein
MSSLLLISETWRSAVASALRLAEKPIKARVSASGFSSLTQCRASRWNKISREMVSMVASLPLRRRG